MLLKSFEDCVRELSGEENARWEAFNTTQGTPVKLGTFPMEDFSERLEELARRIGGGVIKVKLLHANGAYSKQQIFTFDSKTYGAPENTSLAQAPIRDNLDGMLRLMEAKEDRWRQELAAERASSREMMLEMMRMNRSNPATSTPIGELKAMMELVAPKSPMDSISEVLQMLATLRDGDPVAPKSPMEKAIDKAIMLLEPLIKVGVGRLTAALPGGGQGTVPALATLPAPVSSPESAAPGAASSPTPSPEMSPEEKSLKVYGEQLLGFINGGMSPDTVSSMLMDGMNAGVAGQLLPVFKNPETVGNLVKGTPGLEQHRDWLSTFLGLAAEEIAEFLNPSAPAEGEVA